jgi:hypothetical protein
MGPKIRAGPKVLYAWPYSTACGPSPSLCHRPVSESPANLMHAANYFWPPLATEDPPCLLCRSCGGTCTTVALDMEPSLG